MTITLSRLRSFATLAETGSFRRTSEIIGRSQPALSAQIKSLEDSLGMTLFFRKSRQVSLTPEGEIFLTRISRILSDLDEVIDDFSKMAALEKGEVNVGAAPTLAVYIVPEVIRSFRLSYPKIRVRFSDDNTPRLERMVSEKLLDFYFGPQPPPGSSLLFDVIAEDEYVVVVSDDHELAGNKGVTVKALSKYPWVFMRHGTSVRREVERFLAREKVEVDVVEEVANHFTLGALVAKGFGVSLLPRTAMPLTGHPGITPLPLNGSTLLRTLGVATRPDYVPTPAAKQFMEMVFPLIRAHSSMFFEEYENGLSATRVAVTEEKEKSLPR